MKKILFATDFSPTAQNAFRYALRLADVTRANIEVLHVVFPEYESMDLPSLAGQATKDKVEVAREVMKTFVEVGLAQVQSTYQFKEVPSIKSDIEVGGISSLITKIAQRDDADIIMLGTKGEHNAMEKILGSVSTGVMENATVPVYLIPEKATFSTPTTVIYATDLQEADPMQLWKIANILEPFTPIIRCIHVHHKDDKQKGVSLADFENFFETQHFSLQVSFHEMREEGVALGIQEFAELHRADLITVFKPRLHFLQRLFHTSTSRQLALHSNLPIIILK